jgi:hypothetical protein
MKFLKSFQIFENHLNLIKSGSIKVKRYCNPNTINTFNLRGGTWFSYINDENAERYNQSESKIGGTTLITGEIKYSNPFILTNTNTHYVLSDFQLFSYIDIFTKKDKDFLLNVSFDKNKNKIIKESLKYNVISDEQADIINKFSIFNALNVIVDNLLTKRLKENNRDVFIRLDQDDNIFEVFDINNLFKQKTIS